jgi:membrane associated rhomboid family serine protease
MVIIPLSGKVSWKNPPVITIALIVINCLIYFVVQANDKEYAEQAQKYYFFSGLARMEISAYIVHEGLDKKDPGILGKDGLIRYNDQNVMQYASLMFHDARFGYDLDHERIITPADERYSQWKEWRTKYKNMNSKVIAEQYGFKPAEWTVLTAFTCMFLHGGFEHLLGNMVFLWLVGCILEMGCGRVVYLAMYLLGGMCASLMFALVNPSSLQPLIGASGAIASIIGAYMVLYGKRKIKVLYYLGFYFNTAMVPAIVILPIWVANEVFQNFFNTFSNVAYMAHVGGLISGSVLGFINLVLVKKIDTKVFDEDLKDKIPGLLEEAMHAMEKLDSVNARTRLKQILAIDPHYPAVLTHLYNVEKMHPKEVAYDEAANKLLEHLIKTKANSPEILRVYKEYLALSGHPRISLDLLFRICSTFITGEDMDEGEKIISMLAKKNPESKQLLRLILLLAKTHIKRGNQEKALHSIRRILDVYPSSYEATLAQELMQNIPEKHRTA